MIHRTLTPPGFRRGRGYSHGIEASGRMVFVAGMVGWDAQERFSSRDFVEQFRRALDNTKAVLETGGAGPEHVVRMTWFIVDKKEYLDRIAEVGAAYRDVMGKNFPAMAVVVVQALIEDDARVEIETTAVIPE